MQVFHALQVYLKIIEGTRNILLAAVSSFLVKFFLDKCFSSSAIQLGLACTQMNKHQITESSKVSVPAVISKIYA